MSRFRRTGVLISFPEVFEMYILRNLSEELVEAILISHTKNLDVRRSDLTTHAYAGGRPLDVVKALEFAKQFHINTTLNSLFALDLGGYDVGHAVRGLAQARAQNPLLNTDEWLTEYMTSKMKMQNKTENLTADRL